MELVESVRVAAQGQSGDELLDGGISGPEGNKDQVALTCMQNREDYRVRREGQITLKLAGTPWDPLDTIPIVSVGKAYYSRGDSSWIVPWFDRLPDRDAYLPFIYGQKYDDFRLFPVAPRYRNGSNNA